MAETQQMSGVDLIAAERRRQVDVEGWTPEHDDLHTDGRIADGAAAYAAVAAHIVCGMPFEEADGRARRLWTWARKWWKPSPDPIRNLVKAGALIAAEIDRLQRKHADTPQHSPALSRPGPVDADEYFGKSLSLVPNSST